MISRDVIAFSKDFHDEIREEARSLEAAREEVFVQKMGDVLEEYGEIETLIPCIYSNVGMRVDGYCYDDEFKGLTLLVSHYLDEPEVENARIANSDIARDFKRGVSFLSKCLDGLYGRMEVSNEAYDLARLIHDSRDEIKNAKIVLLTDGVTQKRPVEVIEVGGIEVSCTLWDIEITCHFHRTGERERINIDFSDYCNGPLPCVVKEDSNGVYTTYLGFIPGSALADMYAIWGIKMLDTLSWLFHLTDSQVDLEKIWQKQSVGEPIINALQEMSHAVNKHIRNTNLNVTEYCKKEECWNKLKGMDYSVPSLIVSEFVSSGERKTYQPTLSRESDALSFCKSKDGQSWFDLAVWLKQRDFLTPKARSQCFNMGSALQKGKDPSIALSLACRKAWEDAEVRGWNN